MGRLYRKIMHLCSLAIYKNILFLIVSGNSHGHYDLEAVLQTAVCVYIGHYDLAAVLQTAVCVHIGHYDLEAVLQTAVCVHIGTSGAFSTSCFTACVSPYFSWYGFSVSHTKITKNKFLLICMYIACDYTRIARASRNHARYPDI